MKLRVALLFSVGIFLACAVTASAQITVPKVLSSHMVIQRDLPVHVWGMAAPGEEVSVTFRGQTRSIAAGDLGHWSIYLPPGAAGGPFQMTIQGQTADQPQIITLDDILVGDVWLASGQSNMEFEMYKAATAAQDLPRAANPQIRLLMVGKKDPIAPESDIDTDGWIASSPESAKNFSAVAWYFARAIQQREHVPVGIIDSTWGGTPVEAWTRLAALAEDASLMPLFASWGKMTEDHADALLRDKYRQRLVDEAKAQGKPEPLFPWVPPLETWSPGSLWNGMIAPLAPFGIRGVIWYQGESNSLLERAPLYGHIFRDMIEDWRRQWGIGDLPFLYVQISNFKSTRLEDWATIREEQRKALELRKTAMAVAIDIGNPDDVHPTDKLDVGTRLALAARALSYGENIEYSGPLFRQATTEGSAMRVWFDHATTLIARGNSVTGFEVAGADGVFVPASAVIDGSTVVANSPQVPSPRFVRYGWANSPDCDLFNGAGLPASPFTSVPH